MVQALFTHLLTEQEVPFLASVMAMVAVVMVGQVALERPMVVKAAPALIMAVAVQVVIQDPEVQVARRDHPAQIGGIKVLAAVAVAAKTALTVQDMIEDMAAAVLA